MRLELKTTLIYTAVGIVVGYLSFLFSNSYIAVFLALVFLVAVEYILKRIFKINEQFKWFLTNGGWIYLFIWFITWVILLNS